MAIEIRHYFPEQIGDELVEKMEALARDLDPDLPDNYIRDLHLPRPKTEVYLAFRDNELVGMVSVSGHWFSHPDFGGKVFVNAGGFTFRRKDPDLRRFTQIASFRHARNHLGSFWQFRPFIAMCKTVNPRLYLQFDRFFREFYPRLGQPVPEVKRKVISDIIQLVEGKRVKVDEFLVDEGDPSFPAKSDISARYNAYYQTRKKELNDFFFDTGVHLREGDNVFICDRSMYIFGYSTPWLMLRKFLGKFF